MADPLRIAQSRAYPLAAADTFARTLAMPLEQIFSQRFGPIPSIS